MLLIKPRVKTGMIILAEIEIRILTKQTDIFEDDPSGRGGGSSGDKYGDRSRYDSDRYHDGCGIVTVMAMLGSGCDGGQSL